MASKHLNINFSHAYFIASKHMGEMIYHIQLYVQIQYAVHELLSFLWCTLKPKRHEIIRAIIANLVHCVYCTIINCKSWNWKFYQQNFSSFSKLFPATFQRMFYI